MYDLCLALLLGIMIGWALFAEKPPKDIPPKNRFKSDPEPRHRKTPPTGHFRCARYNPLALADDFDGQGRR